MKSRRPVVSPPAQDVEAPSASSGTASLAAPSGFEAGSSGEPEPLPHLAAMERAFGADLGGVEAHTGQADALGSAHAAASGESVVFADPDPDPSLVAHEVTHVLQARGGGGGGPQAAGLGGSGAAEEEAESNAAAFERGEPLQVSASPGAAVQFSGDKDGKGSGNAPAPTFDFEIIGKDLQRGDTLAEGSSSADLPKAPDSAADGIGYVATLPTTASGKNKSPLAVAKQYEDEAFDTPSDAKTRLSMVVGVNGFITASEDPKTTEDRLVKEVSAVSGFDAFRVDAFAQTWSRLWKNKKTGKQVGARDVWLAIKDEPSLIAKAAEAEKAVAADRDTAYKGVINWARNQVTGHSQTADQIGAMQKRWKRVMVHVADPDAINLKAEKTPNDAPSGLLDRWDEVLDDNPDAKAATGGYHFRAKGEGNDPHAGQAAKALPQTKIASDLDMAVRGTLAEADPDLPYYPEPNLMLDAELLMALSEKERSRIWGKDGAEWPKAKKALGIESKDMVFDQRASLYTDAGRFDDAFVETDSDYSKGKTAAGPLFSHDAQQSHAKTGVLKGKVATLAKVGRRSPLVQALCDVFLPQEVLDLDAAEDAKAFGALKGMLETMRDNATKVSGVIKTTKWSDVAAGTKLDDKKLVAVLDGASVNSELSKDRDFVAAVGRAIQHKKDTDLDAALALLVDLCTVIANFLLDFKPAAPEIA